MEQAVGIVLEQGRIDLAAHFHRLGGLLGVSDLPFQGVEPCGVLDIGGVQAVRLKDGICQRIAFRVRDLDDRQAFSGPTQSSLISSQHTASSRLAMLCADSTRSMSAPPGVLYVAAP